jgi:integrase
LSFFRRARARTNLPVWLTWDELQRFFACLDEEARLMAQVMYGSGLRLMELLRLRVKDMGLEQEIVTVRGATVSQQMAKRRRAVSAEARWRELETELEQQLGRANF